MKLNHTLNGEMIPLAGLTENHGTADSGQPTLPVLTASLRLNNHHPIGGVIFSVNLSSVFDNPAEDILIKLTSGEPQRWLAGLLLQSRRPGHLPAARNQSQPF